MKKLMLSITVLVLMSMSCTPVAKVYKSTDMNCYGKDVKKIVKGGDEVDVSKEYMRMCDCKEVQNRPFASRWHRWSIWSYGNEGVLITGVEAPKFKNPIWLPRQDQLQGMLKRKSVYFWLMDFAEFVDTKWGYKVCHDVRYEYSMEQLWLAFVMSELHGKRWNGTAWVVGDDT